MSDHTAPRQQDRRNYLERVTTETTALLATRHAGQALFEVRDTVRAELTDRRMDFKRGRCLSVVRYDEAVVA